MPRPTMLSIHNKHHCEIASISYLCLANEKNAGFTFAPPLEISRPPYELYSYRRCISSFAKVLASFWQYNPTNHVTSSLPSVPPWIFLEPEIPSIVLRTFKIGIVSKIVLPQTPINIISLSHRSRANIYTNGSTCSSRSGAGIVIPVHNACINFKLRHATL